MKQKLNVLGVTCSAWLGLGALIEKTLDWLVLTWPFDQIAEIGGKIRMRQARKLYADIGIKLDKHLHPIINDVEAKSMPD